MYVQYPYYNTLQENFYFENKFVTDPFEILPITRKQIYRRKKLNFDKTQIISLMTEDSTFNNNFLNLKLRKSDIDVKPGKIEGTLVFFNKYDDVDLQIPAIVTIQWYIEESLLRHFNNSLREYIKGELCKDEKTFTGKSLNIFNQEVAGTDVKLNIDGKLTVNADLKFQDREMIAMNQTNNSTWDLNIEQTQEFGIDGTIGDRIFVEIEQDSKADFSWENDLNLEYKGKDNDILKSAQGGNISLSLPASRFVSVGSGKNEGLFGIKLAHKIGPLTINTILSREQVKKSQNTFTGGESSGEIEINDYSFIRGVYFFINGKFKSQFYPLNASKEHNIDNNYVIDSILIYKTVSKYDVNVKSNVEAYIDPSDTESYAQIGGLWLKMDEQIDYDVNRKEGWIRLNNIGTDEAVAIAYTLGRIDDSDPDSHIPIDIDTYTDINESPDDYCLIEGWELGDDCGDENEGSEDFTELNGIPGFQPPTPLQLKLVKDTYLQGQLQPTSPAWELMFKNVYSLGSGGLDPNSLEVEVVHDKGANLVHTHNPETGKSYSNIFEIDTENGTFQEEIGGDGKIDIRESIIDEVRGELFLPFHLPFAYDNMGRIDSLGNIIIDVHGDTLYWGNNAIELADIIDEPLNDSENNFSDSSDQGPDMYYNNSTNYTPSKEFIIKTKFSSSSRSSIIKLDGFMIVDNSETVTLNGQVLQKGTDYTINYDSGTIDFSNEQATDPTANLVISYEENELVSFDQKLLAGTHLKYDFNEQSFLTGGLYYYNQSIVNNKVNVGNEPMRNFIWNIAGKYKQDVDFLTKGVDMLPLIETSAGSNFNIEGEYAEVYPNPNPLGQAFIDDFESSKRTTSPNILSRQWKRASIPSEDNFEDSYIRSRIAWYNPFNDVFTKSIWPNQETSSRANNERTKTLWLETYFNNPYADGKTYWNGISTTLFEYNQQRSKYIDIWINDTDIDNSDFKLHIDIGQINEDQDSDGKFDSEDKPLYVGGVGNKQFDPGEDTGLDGCEDSQETGFSYYNLDLDISECLPDNLTFVELCDVDEEGNVIDSELISSIRCQELINEEINPEDWDPNGDNFIYVEGSEEYEFTNGTEGNAVAYPYLDTEDLNKSAPYYSLDILNDYFSIVIDFEYLDEYKQSESINGWKLIRIPLSDFSKKGRENVEWDYVQNMRLWVESNSIYNQKLKIAKIEIVGNEWAELGSTHLDSIYYDDPFSETINFKVEVINTDENAEYNKPAGVIQEVDGYTGLTLREQSLVIAFNEDNGIPDSSMIAIQKTLNQLTSTENRNSFLAYERMNMYVFGGDPYNSTELFLDNTDIELLFRIGKDDNYYEITQKIYKDWDERNEINIDINELNQAKINDKEELADVGLDGCSNETENGFGGCLDSLSFTYYCNTTNLENDSDGDGVVDIYDYDHIINPQACVLDDIFLALDPNGDDFVDLDGDGIFDQGESGEENNNQFDAVDLDGDGIFDQGEPALIDKDGNNMFTYYDGYDEENELFYWENNISHICGNCNELRIKGSPAINNLEYILIGVINKSGVDKKGKILLDELRMTGVKKEKGTAFRLSTALNFADLLTITSSYERKDADFHLLQQRLGLGENSESYNINTTFNPNLFLPSTWGIKTPVSINYSHTLLSPKLRPGTDILSGSIEEAPSEIQTITDNISLSTSFGKSTRSRNWFNKYTIDNISLRFSIVNSRKSTSTIELEEYFDYQYFASYDYKFNKDNYINIFSILSWVPLIGESLSSTRLYYSPERIQSSITLDELDKISKQRLGQDTTFTYNLIMARIYELKYRITNSIVSSYKRSVSSNYDDYKNNKFNFIKELHPGLVKTVTETFGSSYSPDYFKNLGPKITYNPSYSWALLNQSNDDIVPSTAKVSTTSPLTVDFKIKLKEIVKKIYNPSAENNKLIKYSLGNLYGLVSRFSSGVSLDFERTKRNGYDNIYASDSHDYFYKFGINDRPDNFNYNIDTYQSSNSIINKFIVSTSFKLTNKYILNSIKYENSSDSQNNSNQSDPIITYRETRIPWGMNGDEGIPFFNWSINWSMLDVPFFQKYLSKISITNNHSTLKTEQWRGDAIETWKYIQDFNPLLGFSFKTLGLNYWEFDISLLKKLTIDNTASLGTSPTSRTYSNTLSCDLGHSRKSGLQIPILFFKDFYFNNDMTFDIKTTYSHNYKTIDPGNAKNLEDFVEEESERVFTMEPKISYNFTTWVTGYVKFSYELTDNKTSGRTENKDVGFFLSFRIRG